MVYIHALFLKVKSRGLGSQGGLLLEDHCIISIYGKSNVIGV